jgi:hypothetical protein
VDAIRKGGKTVMRLGDARSLPAYRGAKVTRIMERETQLARLARQP